MPETSVMKKSSPVPPRRPARSGADLAALGLVPHERLAEIARVAQHYAVAVTPAFVGLIDPADPADPIARQFVPDPRELQAAPEERGDPIGDALHAPVKGLVHRYPDRVLLTPILHCPVYCRFCFRRERVGRSDGVLSAPALAAALDYVRRHEEVWEVVVSGGDPFLLPPRRLRALVQALDAIPHLGVIRFHSRAPVGDPRRVSPALVAALEAEKAVWVAVHCNHPRELSPPAAAACRRLVRAGIPLVGQTVLLKGVNDDPQVMAPGTGHFRIGIAEGQAIVRSLRGRVSGLCQPCYVLDIPGGFGKVPIGPTYLQQDGTVEDWRGERHLYPPTDQETAAG
jgi:lysine 2,3-aminomutase